MKKLLIPLIVLVLVLAACGNGSDDNGDKNDKKTYKQDDGKKVKVPKHPKRVVGTWNNLRRWLETTRYQHRGCSEPRG